MNKIIYVMLILLVGCVGKNPVEPDSETPRDPDPDPLNPHTVYYASDDGVRLFPGHYAGLKVDDDAQLWKGYITRHIDLTLLDANAVTVRLLDSLGNVLINGSTPIVWGYGPDTLDIRPDYGHRMTGWGFWPENQPPQDIYFTIERIGEGLHLSWPAKLYYSYTGFAPDQNWLPWLQNTRSFEDAWYYYYTAAGAIDYMNNNFIVNGPDGEVQFGQGEGSTEILAGDSFVYTYAKISNDGHTMVMTIRPK